MVTISTECTLAHRDSTVYVFLLTQQADLGCMGVYNVMYIIAACGKCVDQIGIREQPLLNACHNIHIAVYESPAAYMYTVGALLKFVQCHICSYIVYMYIHVHVCIHNY